MKLTFFLAAGATIIVIAAVLYLYGCTPISTREKSESAGFNGSFEIEESGRPVNWYIYYLPIKSGAAEVSLDTTDAVEGKQSLKFVVHRVGGRWPAGLFQVVPAQALHTYSVSFWLKNQGCKVSLLLNSEKPKDAPAANRRALSEEETGINTWRQFEYSYTVPETYNNLRFELHIQKPGTLWIDDVRISQVQTD